MPESGDKPGVGPGPADPRVLQANERTLLAWVRTGLALMALGYVVARIGLWLQSDPERPDDVSAWLGATFLALGTGCQLSAAFRYTRFRRAIVAGRPAVPGTAATLSLALGLAVLGGAMAVYVLIR